MREIFDNPPEIYEKYRSQEADSGEILSSVALHVVVMDEFDAVARARGGRGGKGEQGDAGVARDSVVNQLLAKMDGISPLPAPTLVIGLTNKRSLIEPGKLIFHSPAEFRCGGCIPVNIKTRISALSVFLPWYCRIVLLPQNA